GFTRRNDPGYNLRSTGPGGMRATKSSTVIETRATIATRQRIVESGEPPIREGGPKLARRPELVTQPGMVKGDGRRAKWRGALDADIIIANAPDPVFVSDLEGKILQANDAVSQLLGFRQDEVLEQSLSRFISPEETREFTAALREVVERGEFPRF